MKDQKREDMIPMTTVTLSKWGNSSAVRIPNQLLKRLNLEEGAEIELVITPENELLLRPMKQQQETNEELRSHLKQLLAKIQPASPRHEEFDVGIEGDELI
ncbi:AbrB/MazE/SpoVT family DNA-binding domain-containing protein [Paenibacillus sp. BIHB 4019]|nr:AbrB/MazE/SpoVT family DNA-binding domain-containing protein [Paenibacillus sp. BIHB 4019]